MKFYSVGMAKELMAEEDRNPGSLDRAFAEAKEWVEEPPDPKVVEALRKYRASMTDADRMGIPLEMQGDRYWEKFWSNEL